MRKLNTTAETDCCSFLSLCVHTVYVRFACENLAPETDVTCMQTGAKRKHLMSMAVYRILISKKNVKRQTLHVML